MLRIRNLVRETLTKFEQNQNVKIADAFKYAYLYKFLELENILIPRFLVLF